jgi:dihydroorotate dehydrogenase (fumarate)
MEMKKILFQEYEFDHPIINAAGTCKTLKNVEKLAVSAVAVIVVGSGTEQGLLGNSGNVWHHEMPHNTINSLGLNNPGERYYDQNLSEMTRIAHDHGKAIIYSAAANTPAQFHSATQMALSHGVDFVEQNLGCPNKWREGKQGQIFSFDFGVTRAILDLFTPAELTRCGIKVSPYSDPTMRDRLVDEVLIHYPGLAFLTSSNTFPNGFAFQDNWRPAIDSPDVPMGFGGLAGPGFKEFVLGQNRQLLAAIDKHESLRNLHLIGIGGANSGRAVLEHCRCGIGGRGATLVGVASEYLKAEDPQVFSRMLTEYVGLVME